MKKIFLIGTAMGALMVYILLANAQQPQTIMDENNYNPLTREEQRVILNKGTEMPYSGKYTDYEGEGVYVCKRCNAPLYRSSDKFHSGCGWPSFDDEIPGAVNRNVDADGRRIEITCNNCGGHLGHVFKGEKLTKKNVRHCVNSISLNFVAASSMENDGAQDSKLAKAYFAGGCFWGVEHLFEQKDGVVDAVSGYMGGSTENPTYKEVCYKNTGHLEVVEVTYDPSKITFEELTKFHFEIHDPTQKNGQGPDIGSQYLSAVFYSNMEEKATALKLIDILEKKGYDIATTLRPVVAFWKAEGYHQDYYVKHHKTPYCHAWKKRF